MEIKPYEKNAKEHPDEQLELLAQVVAEVGWRQNVEVNQQGTIIAGHGRYLAWQKFKEKYKLPDVWVTDVTGKTIMGEHATFPLNEEQEKMWRIADNQLNAMTGNTLKLLVPELRSLSAPMFDLTGFDKKIIMLQDETEKVPDLPTTPITQPGDLYELGPHRVLCGDSTLKEAVLALCGPNKVDMLLTDPPYNVDYTGKGKDELKIENDKMEDSVFRKFLTAAFQAANDFMKPGAVFYIWHADSEGYNFRGACIDAGWQVRQNLIWMKNSIVMGRQDYHWKHEPCLYGWKAGASHLWNSDRTQTTILNFDRPTKNEKHPTMKPVDLLAYQITNNTKGEDIVLDLFLGSGSTLIAAQTSGRRCFGMELDPKYVDVIVERYVTFTGNTKIKKNGVEFEYKLKDKAIV